MNKKTIAAFLGGIALTVAISTATPVIKDAVAPKVDAAGTCPITLQPIQSTGNLVFSPFSFYSSDLTNLRAELNDLGAWADGEISSIQSDVSNGKSSLRNKMVSKGASSSLPSVPSFAQLEAAVDDIYDDGYNDGMDYKVTHLNYTVLREDLNVSQNQGIDFSYTFPSNGMVYVRKRLYSNYHTGVDAYVRINGHDVSDGGCVQVSKNDVITAYQQDWNTSDPEKDGYLLIIYTN